MSVGSNDDDMRTVFHDDGKAWLERQADGSLGNIMTGVPDLSETSFKTQQEYVEWFREIAAIMFRKTCPDGYVVFCQTDRRTGGVWLDKAGLISSTAQANGVQMRWHKIALRRNNLQAIDNIRPTYTHLLCFSKTGRPGRATPDVVPASKAVYTGGLGLIATEVVVSFLKAQSPHSVLVDPFAGRGTFLAMANKYGMKAIGVDIIESQCEHARALRL